MKKAQKGSCALFPVSHQLGQAFLPGFQLPCCWGYQLCSLGHSGVCKISLLASHGKCLEELEGSHANIFSSTFIHLLCRPSRILCFYFILQVRIHPDFFLWCLNHSILTRELVLGHCCVSIILHVISHLTVSLLSVVSIPALTSAVSPWTIRHIQFRIMVSGKWDVLITLKESLLSGRLSSGWTYRMKGTCSWTYACFPVEDKCSYQCSHFPSSKPKGSFEFPLAAGSRNPIFFLLFTYLSSFSVLSITPHSRSSLSVLWSSPACALPSLVRSLACKESHLRFF